MTLDLVVENFCISSEEDWVSLFHRIIPEYLRSLFSGDVYHLKDDVSLPEYIVVFDDRAFFIDVIYDHYTCGARITDVSIIDRVKAMYYIPFYHPV